MLPSGHVEFTTAALNLLQRAGMFGDADYRLAALAGIAPDLIDKPLAVFVFRKENATLLFSHTLLLHGLLWAFALGSGQQRALPYLLAFSGHLVADRIWGFPQTFFWPLRGRLFHQWRPVGSPTEFVQAYRHIIRTEPKLLVLEALGLLVAGWFIRDRQLYRGRRLVNLLATGRPAPAEER